VDGRRPITVGGGGGYLLMGKGKSQKSSRYRYLYGFSKVRAFWKAKIMPFKRLEKATQRNVYARGKIPKSETKTSDIRNFCFLACI